MYTITKHIVCELTAYRPSSVDVSRGDRLCRAVSFRLMENGIPWVVPDGASVRVSYALSDGTIGAYDAMPDGSPAATVAGNTVTILLSDQIMAQDETTEVCTVLIGADGEQLAAWPLQVRAIGPKKMTIPENLPGLGAGFEGRILYGGPGGALWPLEIGDGLTISGHILGVTGGSMDNETDPTVPSWAKQPQKPTYTAQEVGADPAGAAMAAMDSHSTDLAAHAYWFNQISALGERLNAALNSEDIDLDQLAEIVAYIRSNRELIDAVTTSKVSVADIVDDLTTDLADRPLSASMGVLLKNLIDLTDRRLVTAMNERVLKTELTAAIEDALAKAKDSGEFDGAPGYTPVKGTDYCTNADKAEMVQAVIAALPVYGGEVA